MHNNIEFHIVNCAPGKTHDHVLEKEKKACRHTRTGCQVDCVLRLTFRRQCLNIPHNPNWYCYFNPLAFWFLLQHTDPLFASYLLFLFSTHILWTLAKRSNSDCCLFAQRRFQLTHVGWNNSFWFVCFLFLAAYASFSFIVFVTSGCKCKIPNFLAPFFRLFIDNFFSLAWQSQAFFDIFSFQWRHKNIFRWILNWIVHWHSKNDKKASLRMSFNSTNVILILWIWIYFLLWKVLWFWFFWFSNANVQMCKCHFI